MVPTISALVIIQYTLGPSVAFGLKTIAGVNDLCFYNASIRSNKYIPFNTWQYSNTPEQLLLLESISKEIDWVHTIIWNGALKFCDHNSGKLQSSKYFFFCITTVSLNKGRQIFFTRHTFNWEAFSSLIAKDLILFYSTKHLVNNYDKFTALQFTFRVQPLFTKHFNNMND